MRAAVLTAYGGPEGLEIRDVPLPTPGPGEVRVRVHATTVTMGDTEIRTSSLPWLFGIPLRLAFGLFRPRGTLIPGMEVAGTVDALGEGVTAFAVGDAVVAATGFGFGGAAECVCVPVDGLIVHKPEALSFGDCAPLPIEGGAAVGYLRKGGLETAKTVLVRGASGSIGTYAVQLAKLRGAVVTAVCGAEATERMVALGADVVLDYTQSDWTENGETYDLILDVVGRMPIRRCVRSLSPEGAYVRGTVPGIWEVFVALGYLLFSRKRVVLGDAGETQEDLLHLVGLLESGRLVSVIDRRYPLDAVAEAHRYVETGHKQGHVVIDVLGPDPPGERSPSTGVM